MGRWIIGVKHGGKGELQLPSADSEPKTFRIFTGSLGSLSSKSAPAVSGAG